MKSCEYTPWYFICIALVPCSIQVYKNFYLKSLNLLFLWISTNIFLTYFFPQKPLGVCTKKPFTTVTNFVPQ